LLNGKTAGSEDNRVNEVDGAAETTETFESAFAALEEIVRKLESGGLGLEEAMSLYESGIRLVRACSAKIDGAELRMVTLQDLQEGDVPF
jgi:exodeoxyribonuclease VII small subunit